MKLTSLIAGSSIVAIAASSGLTATAQESFFERNRYTSVTERPQPAFNPEALRAGAFELSPQLELGVGARSNLFASQNNEVDDVFLVGAPSLKGQSTWSRHRLNFDLNVRHTEYLDQGSETNTSFGGGVGGRVDVTSGFSLTGAVRASQSQEPRSAAASNPNAAELVQVDQYRSEIGAQYQSQRFQIAAAATFDTFDFEDVALNSGGTLDQDFRDYDKTELGSRVSWAVNRDFAVFAEAGFVDRSYDAPTLLNPLDRDSEGEIYRIGANFELPVLLRGDIAIGHQSFDFADPSLESVDGLSFDGRLQWFVSQLLTLSLSGTQTVDDPGLSATAGADVASWTLRGDYEARRNLLLFGEANFSDFDYEGIDRNDERMTARVGATYKINKNAWVETSFSHTNQDSNFQDYSDNRLLLALKLYP